MIKKIINKIMLFLKHFLGNINFISSHAKEADKGWGKIYYNILKDILLKHNCLIGAEIGTAFGGHIENILTTTGVKKIYGIDPYKLFDGTTDSFTWRGRSYTQDDYDAMYKFTKKRLSKFENRISLVRKTSKDAALAITEKLDFVFIDAQHTYEGVLEDIGIWYDKVKVGGIISGHDYNHQSFPGVKKAVDEFFLKVNLKVNEAGGYIWWAEKLK